MPSNDKIGEEAHAGQFSQNGTDLLRIATNLFVINDKGNSHFGFSHFGYSQGGIGSFFCQDATRTMAFMHAQRDFFRPGGRAAAQLRTLTLTPDFVQTAEGSVLVSLGNTRVLTNATIEQGVPGWLRNSGRGWVTAEYAMLPRSTVTRTPRESERGKIGGRTHEIQRLIGRSLRSVVDMQALGERTVILDCDVIQADGGTRTAAITGAAVALALALNALVKAGTLKSSPLKQLVAATSVGIVGGTALLDLCYEEDSQAEVDMNVVITADGGLVETQATAEKGSYSRAKLNELIDLAEAGMTGIFAAQRAVLGI
jgi:ribonuclease PH